MLIKSNRDGIWNRGKKLSFQMWSGFCTVFSVKNPLLLNILAKIKKTVWFKSCIIKPLKYLPPPSTPPRSTYTEEGEGTQPFKDTSAHPQNLISAVTNSPEMIIWETKLINSGFPFPVITALCNSDIFFLQNMADWKII